MDKTYLCESESTSSWSPCGVNAGSTMVGRQNPAPLLTAASDESASSVAMQLIGSRGSEDRKRHAQIGMM